jgi:hypothetical protein
VRGWHPSPGELCAFEGVYSSSELDTRYTAIARGGSLELDGPNLTVIQWAPAYRDVFSDDADDWTVRFSRDRSGHVRALSFTGTRSRFVTFRLNGNVERGKRARVFES